MIIEKENTASLNQNYVKTEVVPFPKFIIR